MSTYQYWDRYYAGHKGKGLPPSQFGAFIANEISADTLVIDIGCGNGRDSFFFRAQGFDVLGLDASPSAIQLCKARGPSVESGLAFHVARLGDDDCLACIAADPLFGKAPAVVIYSRFFLHAIEPEKESSLYLLFARLKELKSARMALEFRTARDAGQPKVTDDHYRRFLDPQDVIYRAVSHGHRVAYFVEGYGFAKFKEDDAHVARLIVE